MILNKINKNKLILMNIKRFKFRKLLLLVKKKKKKMNNFYKN